MQLSRTLLFISCYGVYNLANATEELPLQNITDPEAQPFFVECQVTPPTFITMDLPEQYSEGDIVIQSSKSEMVKNSTMRLSGGVKLASGEQRIEAQEVTIDKANNEIYTTGATRFQNKEITIDSAKLYANTKSKEMTMDDTQYRMNTMSGKGGAQQLKMTEDNVILTHSTFTTCIDEVPDWQISASEINLSAEDNEGETWNTVFRVKDIPVFYLPYFNFPLTDERKTGLLYPEISSSSNSGAKIGIPFYWNIAPNMDATFTPYHMSERGDQLNSEFRYLTGEQFGQINFEYLDKDEKLINNEDSRYLARYQHIGSFADNYRVYVDYSDMSDDNYLVDIGSDQFSSSDAYLWRIGELSYFGKNWHSTVKVQDFKVLGDSNESYETLPQIEFTSYQPLGFYNSKFNFYGEYSRFEIDDDNLPSADRFHFESGISLPYAQPGWFINSDVSVMHTVYQQDNIDFINNSTNLVSLEEDTTRTLPKVRIHTGLNFDRDTSLFVDDMVQTFEPQIQYLYIPYKNQEDIYIYDSASLQDDFDGLFRDRRFSSVDRIAEANQVSIGATSRILNKENTELFRVSLGRIFYLNDTNISFNDEGEREDSSSLAGDLFIQLARRWQLQGDIQYDTSTKETEKSQLSVDYRANNNNLFQVSHRFIRDVSGSDIEQVSALNSYAINRNWQLVGRITQDLKGKRSIESYAGVQYESCCWAVRVAYHRSINTNLDEQDFIEENRDEFDSGIMVQFVLKGLGGNQRPLGVNDMLESGIFGYKRPYFLSN
ncbi:LPS assembly protein LptD [Thalassomonas sp. M1454]|uniref:LPS assembly protein LptD n=1 Tax=Thalassomonas sp. M1454 TaxID=2594477 RepID=UPI00117C8DC4|nr:LPS assembly protein LptD [Thalassomonas sp. M1454]TRX54032.1 LPS assembly protein LptD [Thalassomonas sp. M1454]